MMGRDFERLAALLAADVVWHLPPFAGRPPLRGRDAVLEFVRKVPAAIYDPDSMRFEPAIVVADREGGSALGTLRARTAAGADYENLYSFTVRYAGGRITEAWELLDSLRFVEQTRGTAPQR